MTSEYRAKPSGDNGRSLPEFTTIPMNDDGVCEFNGQTYQSKSLAVGDMAHVAIRLLHDGAPKNAYLRTNNTFVYHLATLAKYPDAAHLIYCDGCPEDDALAERVFGWIACGNREGFRWHWCELIGNMMLAKDVLFTFDRSTPEGEKTFESFYRTFKDEPLLSFPKTEG